MSSLLSRTLELQYHFVPFSLLFFLHENFTEESFPSEQKKNRKCKIVSIKFIELYKEIKEVENGVICLGDGAGYNNKYDEKLTKEKICKSYTIRKNST